MFALQLWFLVSLYNICSILLNYTLLQLEVQYSTLHGDQYYRSEVLVLYFTWVFLLKATL